MMIMTFLMVKNLKKQFQESTKKYKLSDNKYIYYINQILNL